ncbi:Rho termination factor N-terminal domain-containing protein [Hymenobacter lapidarius]|uniref:Rho termination factor N-terminal domain-containing protein n=1 Tax=Hymenobacter lapidarius TaxID=1908237 RepID=UPI0009F4C9FB
MHTINELKDRLLSDLKEIAEQMNVGNFKRLSKQDLIYKILDQQAVIPGSADQAAPVAAPAAEAPVAAPPRAAKARRPAPALPSSRFRTWLRRLPKPTVPHASPAAKLSPPPTLKSWTPSKAWPWCLLLKLPVPPWPTSSCP